MAIMIDKKPEYKGEGKVWECFADNLPNEAVVYNQREVNGREFDFCILMKNVGLIVVEVKGWTAESIFDVAGVDEIIISGYTKPEKSPKKQARAYRFGLLNLINDSNFPHEKWDCTLINQYFCTKNSCYATKSPFCNASCMYLGR